MNNTGLTKEQEKSRLLAVMTRHIGEPNAIDMGELYEEIFGRPWKNRVYDTRKLRKLITELRQQGILILSATTSNSGGYYLASSKSEISGFLQRRRTRDLKQLTLNANMFGISIQEYLQQLCFAVDEC